MALMHQDSSACQPVSWWSTEAQDEPGDRLHPGNNLHRRGPKVREMEGYLQSEGIGLVLKPFDIDDLLRAIEQALRLHEGAATLADDSSASDDRPA
jgi:hypothetical protein